LVSSGLVFVIINYHCNFMVLILMVDGELCPCVLYVLWYSYAIILRTMVCSLIMLSCFDVADYLNTLEKSLP
jgi:hypothetical protein